VPLAVLTWGVLDTGASGSVGSPSRAFPESRSRRSNLSSLVMAEDLLTQHTVSRVLGAARLLRFIHAGWLSPAQRMPSRVGNRASRVLYRVADVHAALRRLERGESCPPDRVEAGRIRASEERNGRAYVKKSRPQRPGINAIELDFSAFNGS
jgi:hypothetical protein